MPKLVKSTKEVEGRLTEEWAVVEEEPGEPWGPQRQMRVIGKPHPRIDGHQRVTGSARFTYDVRLPGLLYAAVLRCPHPHARVLHVDAGEALALPGVHGVVHHANTEPIEWYDGQGLVFDPHCRFAGQEVAAVAAADPDIARDALRLIRVEYEVLPFVVDAEQARWPGAPRLFEDGNVMDGEPTEYTRGDVERGFAEADVIVEREFRTSAQVHNALEPHGSVVLWQGDEVTFWESTQGVFDGRKLIAKAFKLPLAKIRVVCEYMGGGFGAKQGVSKQAIIAALLARQTGQPVHLMLDRTAENLATGHRQPTHQRIKIGAKRDGTLTAIEHWSLSNLGAYAGWLPSVTWPSQELYACPNVHGENWGVFTNLGPFAAFRAPGVVEGQYALEAALDDLAAELGLDPLEIRLRNYAEESPTGDRPYSNKALRECYEQGAKSIGWERRDSLNPDPAARVRRGLGMASQFWGGGGGPPAYATVQLNPDGTLTVVSGTQDIGTGTKTMLAIVAAEAFGLPLDHVQVLAGDTRGAPYGPTSGGSVTTPSMAPAVRAAAEDARRQILDVAGQWMEVAPEDLEILDGRVQVKGAPDTNRTIASLSEELGNFMIVGRGGRGPNPPEYALNTFGAQFVEVEVDLDTGEVRLLQVVAAHDVGRIINPLTYTSQIHGGVIQGIGYGLTEERVVDERFGLVLNSEMEEYHLPTIADVPPIDVPLVDVPDPRANAVGARGAGEPPIIPTAPAIANAVFHATGVRISDLPITRDKVLAALARHSRGS